MVISHVGDKPFGVINIKRGSVNMNPLIAFCITNLFFVFLFYVLPFDEIFYGIPPDETTAAPSFILTFIKLVLYCFLGLPVFMWIYGLLEGFEEKRKRAKQERILEQKRGSNKKQIIEAEKRAAIHKSLRPSREELERKRQEELIEENRKRLASKQPEEYKIE